MELYEIIRKKRIELGMSQTELARLTGYGSRSSINKIESGTNDIPQSKIRDFARALNTTVPELMGVSIDPKGDGKIDVILTQEELAVLEAFRQAPADIQQAIRKILKD